MSRSGKPFDESQYLASRGPELLDKLQATMRQARLVGAWYITAPDAPFPHHMFTFHTDHTMTQANPDAGNQQTSDGAGAGTWTPRRHHHRPVRRNHRRPAHRSAPAASPSPLP